MTLLPSLDIFEIGLNSAKTQKARKIQNAIYNEGLTFCLTSTYIEQIKGSISNKEAFESLIVELYDTDRIVVAKSKNKKTTTEEFIDIFTSEKDLFLLPVINEDTEKIQSSIPSLIVAKNAKPFNRHWIALELLAGNTCNVSYQDFKKDNEIILFFKELFSIPKYVREVTVFDRGKNASLLLPLKGKNVRFYTLTTDNTVLGKRQQKQELQKILGGRTKVYYTNNKRIIHERKIIFETLLVTLDNSQENITVNEPTWEIIITSDKEKAAKWKEKCQKFTEFI